MELLITNRKRLIDRYKEPGWAAITRAVNTYLDCLGKAGIDAGLVELDQRVPRREGELVEQKAIKGALHGLCSEHYAKYLLILGGDEIVPFYRLPDRTADSDRDASILSDSYYVDFRENEEDHWPDVGVGRLPDGGVPGGELLIALLENAARLHQSGGIPLTGGYVGFSTDTWQVASRQTYRRIDRTRQTLHFSPPMGRADSMLGGVTETIDPALFPKGGLLYFNLHGHPRNPLWWGEQRVAGIPIRNPHLIDVALVRELALADCVLLSEACHGAAIHGGRTPENSLALAALQRGAAALFGCTASSYSLRLMGGMPYTESGIDGLFSRLLNLIINDGARFGDAIRDVKEYFPFENAYDEKNILGFTLLGDPMLRFRKVSEAVKKEIPDRRARAKSASD